MERGLTVRPRFTRLTSSCLKWVPRTSWWWLTRSTNGNVSGFPLLKRIHSGARNPIAIIQDFVVFIPINCRRASSKRKNSQTDRCRLMTSSIQTKIDRPFLLSESLRMIEKGGVAKISPSSRGRGERGGLPRTRLRSRDQMTKVVENVIKPKQRPTN